MNKMWKAKVGDIVIALENVYNIQPGSIYTVTSVEIESDDYNNYTCYIGFVHDHQSRHVASGEYANYQTYAFKLYNPNRITRNPKNKPQIGMNNVKTKV